MNILNRIFIFIFFIILFIPLIQSELKVFPDISFKENRIPISRPVPYFRFHSIKSFKASLDYFSKYIDDNFGFRNYFIYFHNRFKLKFFSISSSSQVVLGKMNWLYFDLINTGKIERNGEFAGVDKSLIEAYNTELVSSQKDNLIPTEFSIPDYLGLTPFTSHDLFMIKDNIESFEKSLSKNNIRLLIVVAPNKHTIYPEFLPSSIANLPRKESRLDQIINFMNENSSYKISDYRSIFLQKKVNKKLFYQLDTVPVQMKAEF